MDVLTSLYGVSLSLLFLSLLTLGVFCYFCLLRMRRDPVSGERRRKNKLYRDSSLFLLACALFSAGMAGLNFALFLQTYRIFSIGEPIAEISVHEGESGDAFVLRIRQMGRAVSEQSGPEEFTFTLHGQTWTLQGHLIRFQPWMSYLGVKPVYQLSRVESGYFTIEQEKQNRRELFSLIDRRAEAWWAWAYRHGESLPGVLIVNGSAVSKNVQPGHRYLLKVLPSGFTLEPVSSQAKAGEC